MVNKELCVENRGEFPLFQREENGYREPETWCELETTKDKTVPEDILNVGIEGIWRGNF